MMFAKLLFYMCIGVLINTAFVDSDDFNDELHQLIRKMQQKIDSLEAKDAKREMEIATLKDSIDIEERVGKLEQLSRIEKREADIEERVDKLEQLSRIGTLRSCAEYARFVTKFLGFLALQNSFPPPSHFFSQML